MTDAGNSHGRRLPGGLKNPWLGSNFD
jgi:hypothetical protein